MFVVASLLSGHSIIPSGLKPVLSPGQLFVSNTQTLSDIDVGGIDSNWSASQVVISEQTLSEVFVGAEDSNWSASQVVIFEQTLSEVFVGAEDSNWSG